MDYLNNEDYNLYVVTNPELGGDCVCGLYKAHNEDDIMNVLADEFGLEYNEACSIYVIHHIGKITTID